jgi:GT2 family glycosyltransferase
VVVPFTGTADQLARLLHELMRLRLSPGDEVIVADNRGDARSLQHEHIRVQAAAGIRTPGFARNQGATTARGDWLVFIDADTHPRPSLLDDYFDPAPHESAGVLAGAIHDIASSTSVVGSYSAARGQMSQDTTLRREWPYAQTANCAVRRRAFDQVGGFVERARAGEDADLCFRLQAAGWTIEERPGAVVEHRSRESLGSLLGQLVRHGSGAAWVERRFPGSFPTPSPPGLARRFGHDARTAVRSVRDRRVAQTALLDLVGGMAFELGRLLPNRRALRTGTAGTDIRSEKRED